MAKYGSFKYGQAKYGTGGPGAGTGDPVAWTDTGGGNHGGEDWIISTDTVIAGVHRNVGRFAILDGVVVTLQPYDGSTFGLLDVYAHGIDIAGALIGSALGYRGGAAASAGEGPFGGAAGVDGGYLTGAGQGDATTDTSAVRGSGGGGGSTLPGGAGGGVVRLFAAYGLVLAATGQLHAHGGPEGQASAGHGAGGGIVLHCEGPAGVTLAGEVKTLGGATLTVNGGTVKEFSQPGHLTVSGTVSAGRTYQDTNLRRSGVLT